MKRFLILFTLIAFSVVGCAGPSKVKVGWTKPDFRQDQFEKDREECMETANKEESYSQTSGVFDYCMFKKGYEYQPQLQFESSFDKKDTAYKEDTGDAKDILKTVVKVMGGIVVITLYGALLVLAAF
jgi:hypothetical protein